MAAPNSMAVYNARMIVLAAAQAAEEKGQAVMASTEIRIATIQSCVRKGWLRSAGLFHPAGDTNRKKREGFKLTAAGRQQLQSGDNDA
jgi:agmatine/peptidylarginine deiminase